MLKEEAKIRKEKNVFLSLSLKSFANLCAFFAFLCEINSKADSGIINKGSKF